MEGYKLVIGFLIAVSTALRCEGLRDWVNNDVLSRVEDLIGRGATEEVVLRAEERGETEEVVSRRRRRRGEEISLLSRMFSIAFCCASITMSFSLKLSALYSLYCC